MTCICTLSIPNQESLRTWLSSLDDRQTSVKLNYACCGLTPDDQIVAISKPLKPDLKLIPDSTPDIKLDLLSQIVLSLQPSWASPAYVLDPDLRVGHERDERESQEQFRDRRISELP